MKTTQAYECSNCGSQFESKAQPGNVRHKCKDGKTGVGKLFDHKGRSEPITQIDDVEELDQIRKDVEEEELRKDVEMVEEIPGDVEFTVEETEEDPEGFNVGTMPGVEIPEPPKPKSKPTKKAERNKIESFIRGIYAMTGQINIGPEEEAEILADIWAGVGEVEMEAPQIHVGGRTYLLIAGLITAGLMGRRQLQAYQQAQVFNRAKKGTPEVPKPLEPHEGWD